MKHMHDFYTWLSLGDEPDPSARHRLAALMLFDRERLLRAVGEATWFLWDEEQRVVVS